MKQNEIIALMKELEAYEIDNMQGDQTYQDILDHLSAYFKNLITYEPSKLIQLLYRLDIDEDKVHKIMEEHSEPASLSIATLVIERQLQKIKLKESLKKDDHIPDNEKW